MGGIQCYLWIPFVYSTRNVSFSWFLMWTLIHKFGGSIYPPPFVLFYFETGSHWLCSPRCSWTSCVKETDIEVWKFFCLIPPSARITCLGHHTFQKHCFFFVCLFLLLFCGFFRSGFEYRKWLFVGHLRSAKIHFTDPSLTAFCKLELVAK